MALTRTSDRQRIKLHTDGDGTLVTDRVPQRRYIFAGGDGRRHVLSVPWKGLLRNKHYSSEDIENVVSGQESLSEASERTKRYWKAETRKKIASLIVAVASAFGLPREKARQVVITQLLSSMKGHGWLYTLEMLCSSGFLYNFCRLFFVDGNIMAPCGPECIKEHVFQCRQEAEGDPG